MLILNPHQVTFGATRLDAISSIKIDRLPRMTIEEWTDLGPYAALADVAEQRIRIRIVQTISRGDLLTLLPGAQGTLAFHAAPNRSDVGRRKISLTAVILACEHELSGSRGATRAITFAAISDGAADPITITDAPTAPPSEGA
jgi:hypothetical protein